MAIESINNGAGHVQSAGNKVIGVSGSHISTILEIGLSTNSGFGSTDPVIDTDVVALHADSAVLDCVVLSNYVNKVNFIGGELEACGGVGISIISTGTGTVVSNLYINGLRVDHAASYGLLATNSTSGPPVTGVKITASFIGDSYASPRQLRGIFFQAGTVTDAYIVGNTLTGNVTSPTFFQNTWGAGAVIGPNITGGSDTTQSYIGTGTAVTSAASITPTGPIFHVTGTASINTIVATGPPAGGGGTSYCITIVPDGAFTTATGNNIAVASTAVVNKLLTMCYDATAGKWYPSY